MKKTIPFKGSFSGIRSKIRLTVFIGLYTLAAKSQMVTTVAGGGPSSPSLPGAQATNVHFQNTNGIAVDASGNLYICESDYFQIYKVTPSGVISVFAGNGSFAVGGDGGQATAAGIGRPEKILVAPSGNVYFSSAQGQRVRMINASGVITTVAGNGTLGFSGDGGPATSAQFNGPMGIAMDAAGNLYIVDTNNSRIRKVTASTGIITTIAGNGLSGNTGDGGLATAASMNPVSVALDAAGNIYFDNSNTVRKINAATGIVTRVAGNGNLGYSGDGGPATAAQFANIFDVKLDASGNVYIPHWTADGVIRKVSTTGTVTTIAGTGTPGYMGDGGNPLFAAFNNMNALAVDASGNLYIGDNSNGRIRKLDFSAVPVCPNGLSIAKTRGPAAQATFSLSATPSSGGAAYSTTLTGNPLANPMSPVSFTNNPNTHTFPGNGIYNITSTYHDVVSGTSCYRFKNDTIMISNSAQNKRFDRKFALSNNYFCNSGTVTFRDSTRLIYSITNPSLTYTVVTDWGNGVTVTNTATATNQINVTSAATTFTNPGVYTVRSILKGPGVANDTAIRIISVDACGPVGGMVYNDVNNDCNQAWSDPGIANIVVTLTQGTNTYMAWTGPGGNYAFANVPVGTYTIQSYGATTGYTTTCPASMAHAVTIGTTGIVPQNFAMTCAGFDVAVSGISLFGGFYPGQQDRILPHVGILNGTCDFVVPGKVKMVLTPCIHYVTGGSGTNAPHVIIPAITGDTLVWNVADINAIGSFSYWNYAVSVTTCTSAVVGDSACITMIVLPTAGDINPANNTFTRCFAIGVSYDPNAKEVTPAGKGVRGDIPASTNNLTYTIHFQNTGTAKAFNIYLLDTISSNLNLNSIEILASSHSMQPYLLAGRTMKFMFANIMLPDSTTNEELSHGFVTYRIRLNPGLAPNTPIKNTAYIYFDYNAPVVTNTALNTIEDLLASGLASFRQEQGISVFPNPARNYVTVTVTESGKSTIVITDVLGKEMLQAVSNERRTELNTADLTDGIYIIRVTQNGHSFTQKLVVGK